MTTIKALISAATAKGYTVDQMLDEERDTIHIGFTKGKGVWHWWISYNGENCYFHQSYSQNNGRTYKSFNTGYELERGLGLC